MKKIIIAVLFTLFSSNVFAEGMAAVFQADQEDDVKTMGMLFGNNWENAGVDFYLNENLTGISGKVFLYKKNSTFVNIGVSFFSKDSSKIIATDGVDIDTDAHGDGQMLFIEAKVSVFYMRYGRAKINYDYFGAQKVCNENHKCHYITASDQVENYEDILFIGLSAPF